MIDLPPPPPPAPEPPPEGWEGILEPGEQILWQGQPEPGIDWRNLDYGRVLFGLFFAGFALFWMVSAFAMSPGGVGFIFPLFGLPFLFVGLQMAGKHIFFAERRRLGTHYTLTDRSAFIATSFFGKRQLKRTQLRPGMPLALEDGAPGNVWFDEDTHAYGQIRNMGSLSNPIPGRPTRSRGRIGFERIAEPRKVWQLIGQNLAALAPPDRTP